MLYSLSACTVLEALLKGLNRGRRMCARESRWDHPEKVTFSREAPSFSNRPVHPWVFLQTISETPNPNQPMGKGDKDRQKGGGCQTVMSLLEGWNLLQQLSLQSLGVWVSCIPLSTCCILRPRGGNQRNLQFVI